MVEHPCGDWPAPCNCDDPETHDGAVKMRTQPVLASNEFAVQARVITEYRDALARVAALVYADHERWNEDDTHLQTAQKRGGTIERIGEVILDLDATLFDDPGAEAWLATRQSAPPAPSEGEGEGDWWAASQPAPAASVIRPWQYDQATEDAAVVAMADDAGCDPSDIVDPVIAALGIEVRRG